MFLLYNYRLTLLRGCTFLKRIAVFFFSFFLFCAISTARSDEVVWTISAKGPGEIPESVKKIMAQTEQPSQQMQPQSIPQQAQPQPQTTPAATTPIPTRIQRSQQVRDQQEMLRQQTSPEANVPQAEKTVTNGTPTSPQTTPAQPRRATPRASGMISLNFDDADVYSVAQTIFGEILRVNYVIDQRVKGRVTFRSVAPVATDQVLPLMEVIFRLNGIGVVEESGLYRVVPIGDVAKEPAQVSMGETRIK